MNPFSPMFPKAVLFDFDGVIVNSKKAHNTAWMLAHEKLFNSKLESFPHQELLGKSPMLIAEYFCEQQNAKQHTKALFDLKDELIPLTIPYAKLLPGVREIQSLLVKSNIPYGIASNATRQFLSNTIENLALEFETYLGFEDYINPKPHPEPYLNLAKKLKIADKDFDKVWVFEDSPLGIKAAKKAKMIPIGILTVHTEDVLTEAGSILNFRTLQEAYLFLLEQ
ncbi:HAD family phosphatase [uncultured Algibacter sp.]|uniref:HAD family hydrolase n=1 Tax=uncultured Algibacter sp. TaxID=298659 RepID=UPI0032171F95